MKKPHYPFLAEEIAYGQREGLFNDPKGRALVKIYKLGLVDEKIAGMILYRIRNHQTKELFNDHPFKTPPGEEL